MRWIRNCIAAEVVLFCIAVACAPQGAGHKHVPGISLRIDRSFADQRGKVFSLWTDLQVAAKWFPAHRKRALDGAPDICRPSRRRLQRAAHRER